MRLFAIARFSSSDLNITEYSPENAVEGFAKNDTSPENITSSKNINSCYNDTSWDIYQNAYLSSYSENCMGDCATNENNGTDDIVKFSTLSEAKDYLKCCNAQSNVADNNGITQEKIGVYTIRKGRDPGSSDSCEISWVYKP